MSLIKWLYLLVAVVITTPQTIDAMVPMEIDNQSFFSFLTPHRDELTSFISIDRLRDLAERIRIANSFDLDQPFKSQLVIENSVMWSFIERFGLMPSGTLPGSVKRRMSKHVKKMQNLTRNYLMKHAGDEVFIDIAEENEDIARCLSDEAP